MNCGVFSCLCGTNVGANSPKVRIGIHYCVLYIFVCNFCDINHSEFFCIVCGGHLVSMNFIPKNWEGYYSYSSKVGGKKCPFIGVKIVPLSRGVSTTTLPFIHLVIFISLVHLKLVLCFTIGKAHGWGTFLKCEARLSFPFVLGPLFWACPHLNVLPYM